jgi:hypothetical protein
MVIGPTPPGTGVIAPATSEADVEIHVAHQARLPGFSGCVHPVDADVDHGRPRLDPIARAPSRAGRRRPRGYRRGGRPRPGPRARMGDGHRAAFPQQKLRHRLAHEVRAPDHDRLHPRQAPVMVAQHHQAPQRRAGHQRLPAPSPAARIRDVEPVHVLFGRDPRSPCPRPDVAAQGTAQDAVHRRIGVQLVDQREKVGLGRVRPASLCSKLAMPTSTVCLPLLALT